jgi:hypothetical protein
MENGKLPVRDFFSAGFPKRFDIKTCPLQKRLLYLCFEI